MAIPGHEFIIEVGTKLLGKNGEIYTVKDISKTFNGNEHKACCEPRGQILFDPNFMGENRFYIIWFSSYTEGNILVPSTKLQEEA